MLRNKAVSIGDLLLLVGVDDPATGHRRNESLPLIEQEAKRFKILLKHRPAVSPEHIGLFDLQLSGHAHRGQIFPFNLLTHLAYPMQNGLYRLPGGGILYASRGTGSWGPPLRIGAPPEITLFEIIPTSNNPR